MGLDARDEDLRPPGLAEALEESRRAAAAHRHFLRDGELRREVARDLRGRVTESAGILLGYQQRHVEHRAAASTVLVRGAAMLDVPRTSTVLAAATRSHRCSAGRY